MTIKGASILITGGTGSFGNAFVDRALLEMPKRIVIYSRDEQKQEIMARRLGVWNQDHPVLRFFIGDVRDLSRLDMAMHGIDTVVHAAALKIVPTAEYNPTECIATNVGGAQNVVKAAINRGVQRVLALSTDKAVNPVNLYGASKLAAEKIFVASNAIAAGKTAFSVMRYGNVVGSRGSVVPLFERLAQEGKPLTVTDERMTRFWITLNHAVEFSRSCLKEMIGREIFVPKIPSVKIIDLARSYSQNIVMTGVRPGEKINETLISEDEARITLDLGRMFVISQEIEGKLPAGFSYRSDTNTEWINPKPVLGTA